MEDFNELLIKLQEVHDREIEGWTIKVQELSNKKGCDSKRMEELYSRNQQMKEQQRILTENIKTLENRLRAGLCDRCTVTQEVAKKRQQEFETLHLQSMQHISVMVSEINNLKKDNKLLRDEIRSLRSALESQSDLSTTADSKRLTIDPSTNILPMSLVSRSLNRSIQPPEGDMTVKVEHRTDESRSENRHVREWNKSLFSLSQESYKPAPNPVSPSWKQPRSLDRRSHSDEHPPSSSPPVKPLPSSSELRPQSRHILHAPVPCRPQPLRSAPGPLPPWIPLTEAPGWATAAASSHCPKPRFPNLVPLHQHVNSHTTNPAPSDGPTHSSLRRHTPGQLWHKPSTSMSAKEPTLVFRLRAEQEQHTKSTEEEKDQQEGQGNHQENQKNKENQEKSSKPFPSETESYHDLSECEGPLDLSDSGRCKPVVKGSSPPGGAAPEMERSEIQEERGGDAEGEECSAAAGKTSPENSRPEKPEETKDHSHKLVIKHLKQNDQINGKKDKKVPVLTISLRPVVVLESLNSAVQKPESLTANQNSSEAGGSSSSEEKDDSGEEGQKRKRESDSEPDSPHHDRKVRITMRTEDKNPD